MPSTDTYIAKDSAINDEIDKMRHSATSALIERKDVVVVSSVSCIYGLGDPEEYKNMMLSLRPGMEKDRDELIRQLIDIQYTRNEMDFTRGTFRVKGDIVDILPVSTFEDGIRIEFFGDEIDRIVEFDPLTGEIKRALSFACIFPASHYVVAPEKMKHAIVEIEEELKQQVAYFKENDKLLEAQRIRERTEFDMEMLQERNLPSADLLRYMVDGYLFLQQLRCAVLHFLRLLAGDFTVPVVLSSCLAPAPTSRLCLYMRW